MMTIAATTGAARAGNAVWRRIGLLLQADVLRLLRAKDYLFWVSVFPIGLMLLFGMIWGGEKINPADPNSLPLISYLAPGLLVLSLLSNGIGYAETMAIYREKGILRRVESTPLPVMQLMLSHIIVMTVILLGQAGLMIAVSILVFNARYDGWGLVRALPAVALGAVMFIALGQVVGALARKVSTVNLITMTLLVPLMFLGNLWTPLNNFPEWLQAISRVLPTTLLVDLLRELMGTSLPVATNVPLPYSLLGVLAYLGGALVIAARFFKWR